MGDEPSFAGAIAVACLPYVDPVRRLLLRRHARRCLRLSRWPGEAAQGRDVAELCLLRLLWLQSQARRCGSVEARAQVSRAAVEACIVGVYCLGSIDPMPGLRRGNARSTKKLLSFLAHGAPLPAGLVDELVDSLSSHEPTTSQPSVETMAREVAATGLTAAADLYDRFYVPYSVMYAHSTGLSLLRHVGRGDRLRARPEPAGSRRSAVHVVDACLGILVCALGDVPEGSLPANYTRAHLRRAVPPVTAIGARGIFTSVDWRRLPAAVRSVLLLRTYYRSGAANEDPPQKRREQTRALVDVVFAAAAGVDERHREIMADGLCAALLAPKPGNRAQR